MSLYSSRITQVHSSWQGQKYVDTQMFMNGRMGITASICLHHMSLMRSNFHNCYWGQKSRSLFEKTIFTHFFKTVWSDFSFFGCWLHFISSLLQLFSRTLLSVFLWSCRNVLWTTRLHLILYHHGGRRYT